MPVKRFDTPMWAERSNALSRRRFLSLCGGLLATALVASCIPEDSDPEVDRVTLAADDVPESGGEPLHSEVGRFYLINNRERLLALSTRCTHQGCTVKWNGGAQSFDCPCHGSRFDRRGVRLEGPARRPLDLVAINHQPDGRLRVDTTTITEREEWTPDQTAPTG